MSIFIGHKNIKINAVYLSVQYKQTHMTTIEFCSSDVEMDFNWVFLSSANGY